MTEAEYAALVEKYTCKNSARWKFRALRKSFAQSGVYCYSHFIARGIFGDMDEEARTLKWFERNDPDIHARLTHRPAELIDA